MEDVPLVICVTPNKDERINQVSNNDVGHVSSIQDYLGRLNSDHYDPLVKASHRSSSKPPPSLSPLALVPFLWAQVVVQVHLEILLLVLCSLVSSGTTCSLAFQI